MSPDTWQGWIAWAGLALPVATLAWAAFSYVENQRTIRSRHDYERFMELIARYNNAKGDEPLFTQLAAAFELRNYPQYRDEIWNIWRYQDEKVAELDNVSTDPIRTAKRQLGRFPIKWNPVDRRKRPKLMDLSKLRAPVRAKLALIETEIKRSLDFLDQTARRLPFLKE
jgi:hypothetical protein